MLVWGYINHTCTYVGNLGHGSPDAFPSRNSLPVPIPAPDRDLIQGDNPVSGEEIPSPGIKVSRMIPPSREDLIEVQPQGSVSATMELKAPWIPADGKEVKVQVEGNWRAVWPRSKVQIQDEELHATSGDDVLKGPFESESILRLAL